VLSLREARNLHAGVKLAVQVTDPRRVWSALLLAASRGRDARLYIDPAIANTTDASIEAARRSLPGALPSQQTMRADPDAAVGAMLLESLPETTPVTVKPPRPIMLAENVRRLLAEDHNARYGYELLYEFVGQHNPRHTTNVELALRSYGLPVTQAIIQFLAEVGTDDQRLSPSETSFDYPTELDEREPKYWTEFDIYRLKMDLQAMTIPDPKCPIKPPLSFSIPRHVNRVIRPLGEE
jgi:hypothetical protein